MANPPERDPDARCGSCDHKAHRGRCTRRAPSRCTPLDNGSGQIGWACGTRPQCPCPWRTCCCGALVAVAACSDDPGYEETIERGSAGHPDGTLTVRKLADGTLTARPLAAGGGLAEGEWRAVDHDARCPQAGRRGVVDVTDAAGGRVQVGGAA